jgi:hypothetical protein
VATESCGVRWSRGYDVYCRYVTWATGVKHRILDEKRHESAVHWLARFCNSSLRVEHKKG